MYGGLIFMIYATYSGSIAPPVSIYLKTEDEQFILTEDNENIEIE